jgi:hypothetical protein
MELAGLEPATSWVRSRPSRRAHHSQPVGGVDIRLGDLVTVRGRFRSDGRLAPSPVSTTTRVEQVVDSTPMLDAAAPQHTIAVVQSGVGELLDVDARMPRRRRGSLATSSLDDAKPRQKPTAIGVRGCSRSN